MSLMRQHCRLQATTVAEQRWKNCKCDQIGLKQEYYVRLLPRDLFSQHEFVLVPSSAMLCDNVFITLCNITTMVCLPLSFVASVIVFLSLALDTVLMLQLLVRLLRCLHNKL